MCKLILSADIGKDGTKMVGKVIDENSILIDEANDNSIKYVDFPTMKYDLEDGFIEVKGNSFMVDYNNEKYIIGEQGEEKSYDTSKTNLIHKLCAYTGITQYLKPGTKGNKVYMVLACPLSVLQIDEAKEEYKNFIKGEGEINIKVNGSEYYFTIEDITIKAEGSGILYLDMEKFKGKNVAIIDLGGLNMGFSLYINGVCKKSNRWIEECGNNRLIEIIREETIKYRKGNLISYEQAGQALKRGYLLEKGKVDEESKRYINMAKERYLNEVNGYIVKHKFNIDEIDLVTFVGGTSTVVKEQIENSINHAEVSDEARLTTVKGLFRVANTKYNR